MAYSGGRFQGRRATVADQDRADNTALRAQQIQLGAQAQKDSNSRFNADMAFKNQSFEYNKEQNLLKQQQMTADRQTNEERYQQELNFKREGIQTDTDRYTDKRKDLQYNRDMGREAIAKSDERWNKTHKQRQDTIDNTKARYDESARINARKLSAAEDKINGAERRNSFFNEMQNIQAPEGGSVEAPESWIKQDPNIVGISNIGGQNYVVTQDGKKESVSGYQARMGGGTRRSSGGRQSLGGRQTSSGRTKQQAPTKTYSPDTAYYGKYFRGLDDATIARAGRIFDGLGRNYNIDEATAHRISEKVKSLATNKGVDMAWMDNMAEDSVRKLDPEKAENSMILALHEDLAKNHNLKSKREMAFRGKPWDRTIDRTDSPEQKKQAFDGLNKVRQLSGSPANAKAEGKKYLEFVRTGYYDNSSAQEMVAKEISDNAGRKGSVAYGKVLRNLQADIKRLREHPSYIPSDRTEMIAMATSNSEENLESKDISANYDGMIVNSRRKDVGGGTRGVLDDIVAVMTSAQAYIDKGSSAGDEDDLQEKKELVRIGQEKLQGYIKENSKNDSMNAIWLAQLANRGILKADGGLFAKLDMPNKKKLVNEGAKDILMKSLRSIGLNEGADKVTDISDILGDDTLKKYHTNIGIAIGVLQKHNDGSVVLDEVTGESKSWFDRINAEGRAINTDFAIDGDIKTSGQTRADKIEDKYGIDSKTGWGNEGQKAQADSFKSGISSIENTFLKNEPEFEASVGLIERKWAEFSSGLRKVLGAGDRETAEQSRKAKGSLGKFYADETKKMAANFESNIVSNMSESEIKQFVSSADMAINNAFGKKYSVAGKRGKLNTFNNDQSIALTLRIESLKAYKKIAQKRLGFSKGAYLGDFHKKRKQGLKDRKVEMERQRDESESDEAIREKYRRKNLGDRG